MLARTWSREMSSPWRVYGSEKESMVYRERVESVEISYLYMRWPNLSRCPNHRHGLLNWDGRCPPCTDVLPFRSDNHLRTTRNAKERPEIIPTFHILSSPPSATCITSLFQINAQNGSILTPCLSLWNVGRTRAEHGAARRGHFQARKITKSTVLAAFRSFHVGEEAPLQ